MTNRQKYLTIVCVICFATLMLYGPAVFFGYVWDDLIWLDTLKRHDGDILTVAFLKPFLIGNVYWRPLAELSLYLQVGNNPEKLQHAINIFLHLGNIVLLAVVGRRAMASGRLQNEFVFYFLLIAFALHPAFVEPIAWVSGRFDLLLTSIFLLSVCCFLTMENNSTRKIAIAILFVAALLTKESAVLFLPMYLGVIWLMTDCPDIKSLVKRERLLILTLVILVFLWLGMRILVLGGTGGGFLIHNTDSFVSLKRLYMILSTIGAYSALLVFPFKGLSTLYPVDQMLDNIWYAVVGVVYLLMMTAMLLKKGETQKIGAIMAVFLVSLLLVLNITQVGFPNNLIQNRYLYPAFGAVLCYFFLSGIPIRFSSIGEKAFSILAIVWISVSVLNIKVTLPLWKSTDSLSQWLYIENPGNAYAANMRATILMKNGFVEDAIDMVGKVAINNPTHGAYKLLGDGHYILGKCKEAYVYYSYAWDMGAFPVEEVEGLIGMYTIKWHQDREEANEFREKITTILANNKDELVFALDRLDRAEKATLDCRDE